MFIFITELIFKLCDWNECFPQAYDLSDDFLSNWIKFIRPSSSLEEANLIAYQQRGSVYLVSIGAIDPSAELRVYVKKSRRCSSPAIQLPPVGEPPFSTSRAKRRIQSVAEESISENIPSKSKKVSRKSRKEPSVEKSTERNERNETADCAEVEVPRLEAVDDSDGLICERSSTTEEKSARRKEGYGEWLLMKKKYKSGGMN